MPDITLQATAAAIAPIENQPAPRMTFTPGRYPYTYAYDYMRSHADEFDLRPPKGEQWLSRGDCAAAFRDNPDKDAICVLLADAYLREHNIVMPQMGRPVGEETFRVRQ